MYIIVGLGNPGLKYQNTKHNVGFMAIDILSKKLNIKVDKIKFKALIGEGQYKGEKIILVKPQTFMNLSGESVQQIMSFYKVGSSGTHNGMKNIIYLLGYDDFPRFRIGVSKPPQYMDLASYVLSNFTSEETNILSDVLDKCSEACLYAIEKGLDKSMNKYNIK